MKRQKRVTAAQLALKTGDMIELTEDDGSKHSAQVLSEPWQLGHGMWVIKVSGKTGGYDLTRCKPMKAVAI